MSDKAKLTPLKVLAQLTQTQPELDEEMKKIVEEIIEDRVILADLKGQPIYGPKLEV